MIKLIAVAPHSGYELRLSFSDGTSGVYDFTPFVDARTEMTAPLADRTFFARHFIELGALAWPNGFDLSAASLQARLREDGKLQPARKVA
ncbi:MAG TPA: DUF2442 domain-containing protein [Rhodanobacteraceae bacterium]